jgi:hypothetical protein
MESIIDTALKAPQKTVFFDHKQYPSMERLSNSDYQKPHGVTSHKTEFFIATALKTLKKKDLLFHEQ